MRTWPVQPRAGFTPLPNEVLAPAIAELTPTQLRLLLGLVYCAEFKREGSVSPNGRWRIAQPLGHELALAAAGEQRQVRDELEALVASRGGVERCASWTLATVQSRGPRFRPGSVAWCVKLPARPAAAGRRDLALKRGAASRAASIT